MLRTRERECHIVSRARVSRVSRCTNAICGFPPAPSQRAEHWYYEMNFEEKLFDFMREGCKIVHTLHMIVSRAC